MNHLHAHGSLTPVIARNDRWFQRLEVPIFYFFFFSFNFFNIWTLLTRIERSCCFVITIRCGRRKKWKRKPSLSLFLSLYLSIYLPLRYRVLLSLRNLWIYRFRRKRFPSLHSRSIVLTNLSFEIEFFVQLIFLSTDNERSFLLSFIFFFFSRITTRPNRKRQLIIKENRASSNPASRNFSTGETKRRIHNAPEKAKQRGQRKKDSVAGLVERTTRINDSPLRAFAFPRLVPRAFLPPPPPPPSFFKHARTNLYFARENQVLLKRRRDEGRFCRLDKRD